MAPSHPAWHPTRCCDGPGLTRELQYPVLAALAAHFPLPALRRLPFGSRVIRRLIALALLVCATWLSTGKFSIGSSSVPTGSSAAGVYTLAGRIVNVADGDTLTVLVGGKQERVRLASIDAPETSHGSQRPGQPYGQASRQALADLVAGRTLQLRCYEHDQYGRNICDVPLPDGQVANRVMVAGGMAWANEQGGGKYLRDPDLRRLEKQARQARLGLWQRPGAVAPWEWRWKCWKALETGHSTPIC
ncbi:thermonuclease family protein [Castellaniella sp. MT123]|uniref:thermonuclease family protein n=1 Tax=Castellaniella sp. MT123 TaxID=3140381 RepID=UPI0031F401E8